MDGKLAPRHLDERIAALAGSQHGVISAAQLHEIGLTRHQIQFRVGVRRLHAVERGVYAVGHAQLTREERWMASVLACGAGAVLSHRAAAAHWGILSPSSGKIDVTVPHRAGRSARSRITVHRVVSPADDERTVHDGIPVTTVARTLLDAAAGHSRRQLVERIVEESERRRLFDLGAVEILLARHAGRPGAPLLNSVIAGYRDEHLRTRQELERRFLTLCEEHGLQRPAVNSIVGPYEVDFLWAEQRLIVECDGRDVHGTRAAFERDRARDAWLTAEGFRVVRFTWRRVSSDAREVARLLRRLLDGSR